MACRDKRTETLNIKVTAKGAYSLKVNYPG
jgi:hypothetical protein